MHEDQFQRPDHLGMVDSRGTTGGHNGYSRGVRCIGSVLRLDPYSVALKNPNILLDDLNGTRILSAIFPGNLEQWQVVTVSHYYCFTKGFTSMITVGSYRK